MSEVKQLTNGTLTSLMPNALTLRTCETKKLEDCLQTGIYLIDSTWTADNAPNVTSWNIAMLEVIVRYGNSDIIQRLTQGDTGRVFVRVMRQKTWKPWRELSGGGNCFAINKLERRCAA